MSLLVSRAIVLCFNAFLTWPRAALGMPGVGRECTTHRFHRNHIKGLFKSAEEKRDSCVSGMGGVSAVTILALSGREWALCLGWYWGTRRCCSPDKSHNLTVVGSVRGWNEKLLERCRGGEQFSALIQGWVCEAHTSTL